MKKWIYLLLGLIFTILAYIPLISHINDNGFTLNQFMNALFHDRLSTFIALDLLFTCVVFWVFMYFETRRYRITYWWLAIIANFAVGLCLAFPLFLFFREHAIEKGKTTL